MSKKRMAIDVTQPNYVRFDDTHVFMNFDRNNFNYLKQNNPKFYKNSVPEIHVFITTQASINESLRFLIEAFGKDAKVVIRIPDKPTTQNLTSLFQKIIVKNDKIRSLHELRVESDEVTFQEGSASLTFVYDDDKLRLETYGTGDVSIIFPDFVYDDNETEGIFENAEQRLEPERFKDKLVEAFKRDCPPAILKNFKTDDEIMEFVAESGEWKVEGEE